MFDKAFLRKEYQLLLSSLSEAVYPRSCEIICKQLVTDNMLRYMTDICSFYPAKLEVDIRPFLQFSLEQEKNLYFPRYDGDKYVFAKVDSIHDFVPGKYNMMEPKSDCPSIALDEMQSLAHAWLIPGIVFDKLGHRIGHGNGYYDQFLEEVKGVKIGISLEQQISQDPIKTDPHDISLDSLVTQTHSYSFMS